METKRTNVVTWTSLLIVGVVMTTYLAAANPIVNPNPLNPDKEKTSAAMKNNRPENKQPSQGLTSSRMPKTAGRMQSQGKASKTMMNLESNLGITDPRQTKTDLPLAPPRSSSSSSAGAVAAPLRGQKNAGSPDERAKQREPSAPANIPGFAGFGRVGVGRLGKEGAAEGGIRVGGPVGGGREEAGWIKGAESDAAQLQQLKGPASDEARLRYVMNRPIADRLQNGRQKQLSLARGRPEEELRAGGVGGAAGAGAGRGPAAAAASDSSSSSSFDRLSGFALNDVPPLAMAEYLVLTGDFNGFDDALADIVAIRLMAPEEAEVYRDTVRLEYNSLLRQEAATDNEYQETDDVLRSGIQPFLPPLAIEYPDYSYYGNQALDNRRGGPFNPARYYGSGRLQADKLEEVLQQMLESIASNYNVPGSDDSGSYKLPSDVKASSSSSSSSLTSSSSSSTLEDQLQSLDQPAEKQTKGKTGGSKGGAGKGGVAGKGKGGKGGSGKGGGGKPRKQDAKLVDAEKQLKTVAAEMPQNKTKEVNSTKSRRPLSKEQ